MKCNKIKNNSVYLSVINSNIIEYIYIYKHKNVVGSGRYLTYCIPSRGQTAQRWTLCLLRNANRTERAGADGGGVFFFFLHCQDCFVPFPPVKAAEFLPDTTDAFLQSNIHAAKQQY